MDMIAERPDLSEVAPEIVAYIEYLERALKTSQTQPSRGSSRSESSEPCEPPTTIQVITISRSGIAKRTPRHLYARQKRGGMGVFDLESGAEDPPERVVIADISRELVLITTEARAFRVPVKQIAETPVRGKGETLLNHFPLKEGEELALIVPADNGEAQGIVGSHLILASARGQVRRIANHYFGSSLQPGTVLYNVADGGAPAAACWSTGDSEMFLITRSGQAIRFAERQIPVRGCLGMRVDPSDQIIGAAAVPEHGGVLIVTGEGKGTVRLMSGFSANKSPGAGGKVGIKAEEVIGAVAVDRDDDVFILSRLGKIIRFRASEIPAKEGVVQGVNCMALRADDCTALTVTKTSSNESTSTAATDS